MFILDNGQCILCGTCVDTCHYGSLTINDGELLHNADKCCWCGHCLAVCPRDAIMIDGDGYDIEDVEEFNMLTKPTPMQIRRQIMMRRSVRRFNDEEVTDSELSFILEAAKYAPTAKNRQGNHLMVVTTKEGREELLKKSAAILEKMSGEMMDSDPARGAFFLHKSKLYTEKGEDGIFYDAPVIIYVFSDDDIDGSICASAMMDMVTAQPELGACYIKLAANPFNYDKSLYKEYDIPEEKKCVIAIALGHTDEEYFSSVPRKEVPIVWR